MVARGGSFLSGAGELLFAAGGIFGALFINLQPKLRNENRISAMLLDLRFDVISCPTKLVAALCVRVSFSSPHNPVRRLPNRPALF